MQNRIIICSLLLLALLSCKNEDKKTTDTAPDIKDSTVAQQQHLTDANFFKTLEGTIAGKQVVMNLVKVGDRIDANYYYVNEGQTIFLFKNWEKIASDSIFLMEVSSRNTNWSPTLAMAITADSLTGTWASGDGKTTYPISLKESSRPSSIPLMTLGAVDSTQYLKFKTDTPTLHIAINVIAASNPDNNWLNDYVKKWIVYKSKLSATATLQQFINEEVQNTLKGYAAEVDSSIVGLSQDGPHYFLNRDYETLGNVVYNENGYLTLSLYNYAYSGGAHGNYNTAMYSFDVNAKKQLLLSDILSIDSLTTQQLLEKNYRKIYALPANALLSSRLFVKKIEPNNNFYLSPKGIGFLYAPYEIASYADGEINIWIPFSELRPYLNADFAKRMQL